MSKKFWLIILISFVILASAFYWYFARLPTEVPPPEISEQKIQKEESKNFKTIELEKPPFLK